MLERADGLEMIHDLNRVKCSTLANLITADPQDDPVPFRARIDTNPSDNDIIRSSGIARCECFPGGKRLDPMRDQACAHLVSVDGLVNIDNDGLSMRSLNGYTDTRREDSEIWRVPDLA